MRSGSSASARPARDTLHVRGHRLRALLLLKGVEGIVPAGTYRVDTEEEQIDGLSFLAYRRLATFIRIPMGRTGTVQDFLVDPKDVAAAVAQDRATDPALTGAQARPPTGR